MVHRDEEEERLSEVVISIDLFVVSTFLYRRNQMFRLLFCLGLPGHKIGLTTHSKVHILLLCLYS